MRDWKLPPKMMCRKHLLGNHVELHMAIGSMRRGRSLAGHIALGQLEVHNIVKHHGRIAQEMLARGYQHLSPMGPAEAKLLWREGRIDRAKSRQDICRRCPECRRLMGPGAAGH